MLFKVAKSASRIGGGGSNGLYKCSVMENEFNRTWIKTVESNLIISALLEKKYKSIRTQPSSNFPLQPKTTAQKDTKDKHMVHICWSCLTLMFSRKSLCNHIKTSWPSEKSLPPLGFALQINEKRGQIFVTVYFLGASFHLEHQWKLACGLIQSTFTRMQASFVSTLLESSINVVHASTKQGAVAQW